MTIPEYINTIFTDLNNDNIRIKLKTKPFINGSIDDIINWMVLYPHANADMEDIKTGETPFFLACRYNSNNDLIKWFIQLDETNLNFKNKHNMSVIDYLSNHKSDSDKVDIPNRIKLLSEFNIIN
jgi:hypothetical protein